MSPRELPLLAENGRSYPDSCIDWHWPSSSPVHYVTNKPRMKCNRNLSILVSGIYVYCTSKCCWVLCAYVVHNCLVQIVKCLPMLNLIKFMQFLSTDIE